MDFVYFLGRFHVLALHLPIGMLFAAALLEVLARYVPRFAPLRTASSYIWGFAAISAIGTVILGYMHYSEGGFDGPSVVRHMTLGTIVAIVTTVCWLMTLKFEQLWLKAAVPASAVLILLVSATGHYGGNITHGSEYLFEYAPGFIRALHGMEAPRSRVTDLAVADPFYDIVKPILDQRCLSCHNDDRRRGELSMATYESVMLGGEFLPVVVAGDAASSALVQRIRLPQDDDDFMPAEGKTPLTARQTDILEWWVNAGAQANTTIGAMNVPADVQAMLKEELGIRE
jgi:uncharacterized membrane protein